MAARVGMSAELQVRRRGLLVSVVGGIAVRNFRVFC